MKKSLVFLTMLLTLLLFPGTASAEVSERSVNLIIGQSEAQVNGTKVTMSAPAQVIDGRTLVPLRFISEAFGCEVQWNANLRTATVILVDQTIEVPIDQNYAIINGDKTAVEVPAQLINGSTMVPLRFISENLGAKVDYDQATQSIAISMNTYINKNQGFQMVLPAGWVIEEENDEGVKISVDKAMYGQVAFADEAIGVNADNFNEFAEECFKAYADYEKKGTFGKEGVIAGIAYMEDGLINLNSYKLLDGGIYISVFAVSEESYNESQVRECDLIINTLQALLK